MGVSACSRMRPHSTPATTATLTPDATNQSTCSRETAPRSPERRRPSAVTSDVVASVRPRPGRHHRRPA